MCCPYSWPPRLFMALLLTYPSLTLAVGSVVYLAMIPLSAYRYLAEERQADQRPPKPQSGKGQSARPKSPDNLRRVRSCA